MADVWPKLSSWPHKASTVDYVTRPRLRSISSILKQLASSLMLPWHGAVLLASYGFLLFSLTVVPLGLLCSRSRLPQASTVAAGGGAATAQEVADQHLDHFKRRSRP